MSLRLEKGRSLFSSGTRKAKVRVTTAHPETEEAFRALSYTVKFAKIQIGRMKITVRLVSMSTLHAAPTPLLRAYGVGDKFYSFPIRYLAIPTVR